MSWIPESAVSQKSSCRHMFHRTLLDVIDPPLRFPTTLVTESGTTCADPRSGSLFGRMAEQSPITLTPQTSTPSKLQALPNSPPPLHTSNATNAHTILSTSLLFTEGAGSRGVGWGCHHHHHLLTSFPGRRGTGLLLLLLPSPSPSMNPLHPSLPPQTQRSSCRGVCACVTRICRCWSAQMCLMFSAPNLFFCQWKAQKRLRKDRLDAAILCEHLDGISVDESWAPYLGLIGKRNHCKHTHCTHTHFFLLPFVPPPLSKIKHLRTLNTRNIIPFQL